jgi:fructosamine-3-kinase
VNVQEELLRQRIDPCLNDGVLTEICTAALGQAAEVRGYQTLTGGCWNRVIGVEAGGRRLVVKVSPHAADEKIIREFRVLHEFGIRTRLPVPEPLLLDADSEFTPGTLMVMTRLPGEVMHGCFGRLDPGQRERVTREISEHLATLHTIQSTGFGGVELPEDQRPGTWPEFWLPRFDQVLRDVAGSAPGSLVDGATAVRPHLAAVLDIGGRSTMTHYDVWSGNVMIDVESDPPGVSGFIDIPGYFADYARELSFAMLFGVADRRFLEVYLRHHDIDDGFELRVSIYNLKMNLRHIQMYPREHFYRQGAAECLETIERHLGA